MNPTTPHWIPVDQSVKPASLFELLYREKNSAKDKKEKSQLHRLPLCCKTISSLTRREVMMLSGYRFSQQIREWDQGLYCSSLQLYSLMTSGSFFPSFLKTTGASIVENRLQHQRIVTSCTSDFVGCLQGKSPRQIPITSSDCFRFYILFSFLHLFIVVGQGEWEKIERLTPRNICFMLHWVDFIWILLFSSNMETKMFNNDSVNFSNIFLNNQTER